ncbi:MAG: response regulator [Zoogloeaceae bacterium]|nr:response regulator [Gammaproteobacteria bacterium]MCP5230790.1 response regulator [Zoogloeaceae bacterium]
MTHVLIVDDSPTEVHVVKTMLTKRGFQVSVAASGEEGIARAKELLPDVILMDIVMPGMNGFQATRQLSNDAATKHIPIIVVTTKDQDTDRMWSLRQGAKDYLSKPVDEDELVAKIAEVTG